MLRFMEHFDPIQVRYGGSEFKRLILAIENAARKAAMVWTLSFPSLLSRLTTRIACCCYQPNPVSYLTS